MKKIFLFLIFGAVALAQSGINPTVELQLGTNINTAPTNITLPPAYVIGQSAHYILAIYAAGGSCTGGASSTTWNFQGSFQPTGPWATLATNQNPLVNTFSVIAQIAYAVGVFPYYRVNITSLAGCTIQNLWYAGSLYPFAGVLNNGQIPQVGPNRTSYSVNPGGQAFHISTNKATSIVPSTTFSYDLGFVLNTVTVNTAGSGGNTATLAIGACDSGATIAVIDTSVVGTKTFNISASLQGDPSGFCLTTATGSAADITVVVSP